MKKHTLLLACAMRILLNLIALPDWEGYDTRAPLSSTQNLPRVGKVASGASRIGY